jgi:hypothetical protein
MLELNSSDTTNEVENVNTTPADSLESPTPQLMPQPASVPIESPRPAQDTPTSRDPWWAWFLVAIGSACLVAVATPVIWIWSKLIRNSRAKKHARALTHKTKEAHGTMGDLVSFSNAPLLPHGPGSMLGSETHPISAMPHRAVAVRLAPRELATAVPSRPELEEYAASTPAPAPTITSECPPPQAPVVTHTPPPVSAVHSHAPPTLLPAPPHIVSSPPQASTVHSIPLPTPTASPTARPPLHSPNSLMRLVAQGRYIASYTPVISPTLRAAPAPLNDDKKPLLGDDQPAPE